MIEYKPKSWQRVVEVLDLISKEWRIYETQLDNGETYKKKNKILYRGQANSKWELKTTLERQTSNKISVLSYYRDLFRTVAEVESFTDRSWNFLEYNTLEKEISEKSDVFRVHLPSYNYLVYMRHHGFPSPLLDWTESPFIAAYFAYISAETANPAIYCYIEGPTGVKGSTSSEPMITLKGPFVKTHVRHFAQRAWYTISTQWDYKEEVHYFCPHSAVFNDKYSNQDVLIKITLPIKDRIKTLKRLNEFNINHFTLFQSEDSLIKTMATKIFDLNDEA
jgi:hypothetical protein